MSNQTNPQPSPSNGAQMSEEQTLDKELQLANYNLQLVQTRANAEYGASVAGQMQRQFESIQRVAKPYAESTIVPKSYQGNIGNCIIALDLAHRMNLPALAVMQNLYVVNGNPSWSSKFLVASINTCGRFTNLRYKKRLLGKVGKIKYNSLEWSDQKRAKTIVVKDFDGSEVDNWECIAYAVEKSTGETLQSDPVTIEMAIKEGWYTKDGSKWVTMPMLMLTYRAAAFWQRVYAPEMSMGFRTVEEEQDVQVIQDVEYEDLSASENILAKPKPTSSSVEDAKDRLRNREKAASSTSGNKTPNDGKTNSMFDMP